MKDRILKFLRDPAVQAVTGIIALIAVIATPARNLLAAVFLFVKKYFDSFVSWLIEVSVIKNWIILLFIIFLVAILAFCFFVLRNHRTSTSDVGRSRARRKEYNKDGSKNTDVSNDKSKFVQVSLSAGVGNAYLRDRFLDSPNSKDFSGSVKFELQADSLYFDSNKQIRYFVPRPDGSKEVTIALPQPVNHVTAAYFLINSGNSKPIYAGEKVGEIILSFQDAPPHVIELVLGKNIREWCPGNPGEYVRDLSDKTTTELVWTGMSKDGASAIIDRLKIDIYKSMRPQPLEKITIVHVPIKNRPETLGVHFSVFGIALELG